MRSVSEWKKRILRTILSEGANNYMYQESLRREVGSHLDLNFDRALDELLYTDQLLTLIITDGRKRYGVDIEKLEEARTIANTPVESSISDEAPAQPYAGEPKGYTFWNEEFDTDRQRKKSRYTIYYKKTDHENFIGQVLSQSMLKPRNYIMGTLSDPGSKISRIWRAIIQAVKSSPTASFTLQDIQDIDRQAVNNNRQAGKIGLMIFRLLGWIKIVDKVGNSTIYALAQSDQSLPPTMDDFIAKPMQETFNDPENLDEIETDGDVQPEAKDSTGDDESDSKEMS
jgi:hypothetical protein